MIRLIIAKISTHNYNIVLIINNVISLKPLKLIRGKWGVFRTAKLICSIKSNIKVAAFQYRLSKLANKPSPISDSTLTSLDTKIKQSGANSSVNIVCTCIRNRCKPSFPFLELIKCIQYSIEEISEVNSLIFPRKKLASFSSKEGRAWERG